MAILILCTAVICWLNGYLDTVHSGDMLVTGASWYCAQRRNVGYKAILILCTAEKCWLQGYLDPVHSGEMLVTRLSWSCAQRRNVGYRSILILCTAEKCWLQEHHELAIHVHLDKNDVISDVIKRVEHSQFHELLSTERGVPFSDWPT